MLLNRVEKALMNNPARELLQRTFEADRLLDMGGRVNGIALEIGCGRGVGTDIIFEKFGAPRVDAFDLDADMVEQARRRLAARGEQVKLWVGDAASIPVPAETYDAVFDFGIIHHIPRWEDAVREVYRVLKPGGRFYAEEVLRDFILNPVVRRLLDHPLHGRFDHEEFRLALSRVGFDVLRTKQMGSWFGWYVAQKGHRQKT